MVVFKKSERLVACVLFREGDAEGRDVIYLQQVFVVKGQRRQGIGRKAFERLWRDVWPQDRRIFLEMSSNNPAGRAFWQALGFEAYSIKYAFSG